MKTKDLYVRYGVLLRKRKTWQEKMKFLSYLKTEFEAMGFEATIMQKEYKSKTSLSLYVNDIKNTLTIYATTYDSPIISPIKYRPFDSKNKKYRNFMGSFLPFLSLIVVSLLLVYKFYDKYWQYDRFSMASFLTYGLLIILLTTVRKVSMGISTRNILFNNTSSVVEILKFAKDNPNYGYVFTDYGNEDYFGYLCLRDYLEDPNKNIYFIDTIGNDSKSVLFLNKEQVNSCILNHWFNRAIFITSGEYIDGRIYQNKKNLFDNEEILIQKQFTKT